jgi:hypothetical protein
VENTPTEILQLIHSAGYWRVRIRASVFHPAQLRDKNDCQRLILQSAIATEGWQYPIASGRLTEQGPDWIGEAANISVFIDYWRFYQSGQFIHHLAIREDHMVRTNLFNPHFFVPGENKKYLAVTASICMLTDIIEFASRLAYRDVLAPRAVIDIELHKMAGRELTYLMPGRRLPRSFWFKDEVVSLGGEYKPEDLISRPADIAVELSMMLFNRAGWEMPRALITEDQGRYTAYRR